MSNEEKVKESSIVRGVCATIQAMAMPTIQNLDEVLRKFGYTIKKIDNLVPWDKNDH